MTLCTAHIRQVNGSEELIFATDSCLTGGEKWKHGIKLFELPRKDCLLCFAGSTLRAYPLVLNLVSSIHMDKYLESPSSTLPDVLDYISELLTDLVHKIISEIPDEDIHELRSGVKFLFGGWDWSANGFRIWELFYSKETESFLFNELTSDDTKMRFYTFLGDPEPKIEKEAKRRFKDLLDKEDLMDSKLDMEPLKVLRDISLDREIREVDGSLQIAKVYKSNRTEFFGIYWESSKGNPCFQGREYNEINKPLVRYFDPDTFEIIESALPEKLYDISEEIYQNDFEMVRDCYDEDGYLKDDVPDKQKHVLRLIFKEVAYRQFISKQEYMTQTPE